MSRRIVEYVGIGDVNPSAQLEIAPQHSDDVALILRGTHNGTQTGNMLEAYDSSGALLAKLSIAGVFQAISISGSVSGGNETVAGLLSAAGLNTPAATAVALSAGTASLNILQVPTSGTPATSGAAGTKGTILWNSPTATSGSLYVCVATNTWLRVGIGGW